MPPRRAAFRAAVGSLLAPRSPRPTWGSLRPHLGHRPWTDAGRPRDRSCSAASSEQASSQRPVWTWPTALRARGTQAGRASTAPLSPAPAAGFLGHLPGTKWPFLSEGFPKVTLRSSRVAQKVQGTVRGHRLPPACPAGCPGTVRGGALSEHTRAPGHVPTFPQARWDPRGRPAPCPCSPLLPLLAARRTQRLTQRRTQRHPPHVIRGDLLLGTTGHSALLLMAREVARLLLLPGLQDARAAGTQRPPASAPPQPPPAWASVGLSALSTTDSGSSASV